MVCLHDNADALRLQVIHQRLGNLIGHAFLNLRTLGKDLNKSRNLRQPNDHAFRYVSDCCRAGEGKQVMLSHAGEADASHDHHLVAGFVEDRSEYAFRFNRKPGRHLSKSLHDSLRSVEQSFASRVFADPLKQPNNSVLWSASRLPRELQPALALSGIWRDCRRRVRLAEQCVNAIPLGNERL